MIIFEDTRNKEGKHKLLIDGLVSEGHQIIRTKLIIGDYTSDYKTYIDTKRNILEVVTNFASKDHKRVMEEIKLANHINAQLIFLIEEKPPYNDLKQWSSKLTSVSGETLYKILSTTSKRYNCRFIFINPQDTAKVMLKLFSENQNGRI